MTVKATTHINFKGDARAALEFYQSVFGGELTIITYKDMGNVQEPEKADQGGQQVLFHQAADFVAFAPLSRALFAVPGIPRRLCLESLSDCLALVPQAPGTTPVR